MSEKVVDVRERYHEEISKIAYILKGLEEGRVYGYNGNPSKADGTLQHNAIKLRQEIASLLNKIEYGKKSIAEEIGEALTNFEI